MCPPLAERGAYRVVIRDSAKQDITEHVAFLAKKSQPAARKLKAQLMSKMRSLSQNPYRCPEYEYARRSMAVYRKLLVYPLLILYTIEEKSVAIEYVIDGRALNLFPELDKSSPSDD